MTATDRNRVDRLERQAGPAGRIDLSGLSGLSAPQRQALRAVLEEKG